MKKRRVQWVSLLLLLASGGLVKMFWPAGSVEPVGPEWVEKAVESIQLTESEHTYEDIQFSDDILETVALAKESGRPILMFSVDGPLGRC